MTDVSLDQPLYEEGEETMHGHGEDRREHRGMVEEREKQNIAARKIAEFRTKLNERELYIFEHRIMTDEPVTLQEIGDHFSISRERARQIEKVLSYKVSKDLIASERRAEKEGGPSGRARLTGRSPRMSRPSIEGAASPPPRDPLRGTAGGATPFRSRSSRDSHA